MRTAEQGNTSHKPVIELSPGTNLTELLENELQAFREFEASGLIPDQFEAKVGSLKPARLKARDNLAIVRHQTALAKVPLVAEFVTEALRTGSEKWWCSPIIAMSSRRWTNA